MDFLSAAILYLFREAYHFIESGETERTNASSAIAMLEGFPITLPTSGYINASNGEDDGITRFGGFWTEYIGNDNSYAIRLNFNNVAITPQNSTHKRFGFSVRKAQVDSKTSELIDVVILCQNIWTVQA